jgi:large repetitive protein
MIILQDKTNHPRMGTHQFFSKIIVAMLFIFCSSKASAQMPMDTLVEDDFTIIIPRNITVDCGSIPAKVNPLLITNCPNTKNSYLFDEYSLEETCNHNYTIYRQWTVFTPCQENFEVFQEIYVEDNNLPVFASMPTDITAQCSTIPAVPIVTCSDACAGSINPVYTEATLQISPSQKKIVRKWKGTDPCGNWKECVQNVLLVDNIKPNFKYKIADVTVECNNVPPPTSPIPQDNCDKNPIIFYKETKSAAGCYDAYNLKREWTVKDVAGNTSIMTQRLYVQDKRAPTFTPPAAVTVACNSIPAVALPAELKIADNCTKNVTIKIDLLKKNITCPNSYDLVRVYTVSDRCANKTTRTQSIFVRDTDAPTMSAALQDATVSCNNIPAAPSIVFTDNCAGSVTNNFSQAITNGACTDNYNLKREWTVSDVCANSKKFTQNIIVKDSEAPTFTTAPNDITLTVSSGILDNVAMNVADNCDLKVAKSFSENIVSMTPTSGNNQCTKYMIRTWLASDNCNNTASVTQNIYVKDDVIPVIINAPADVTLLCNQALPPVPTNVVAIDTFGIITDNLSVAFDEITTPGGCNGYSKVERFWTAIDACNNAKTVKQTITYTATGQSFVANYGGDRTNTNNAVLNKAEVNLPAPSEKYSILEATDNTKLIAVEVFNFNGEQIFKADNFGRAIVLLNQYPTGIYILKIFDGKKYTIKKIMKN